ncbi:MAG: hypothetical protein HFJ65_06210 [Eggerthellaceae bacterium]|nr:hypothetical protein [Eggerthellaceae bacterium]
MSPRPAYNYGSTARKLRQEPASPARSLEVVQGGRRAEEHASNGVVLFARALIILIVGFALIGCVRISLSSATVAAAMEASQIDDQISEAREVGSQLEVTQSSLANPTRVKRDALAIGMRAPATNSFIDITGDVVVRGQDGRLLLSGTVSEAAAQAAAAEAEAAEAEASSAEAQAE